MKYLINYDVFLLFLGGLFSLILTVIIIIVKQEYKRSLKRQELKGIEKVKPEEVGDVEAKLNDSYEYRKLDFWELLAVWGLQPLFIICFLNLFADQGPLEVIIAFTLTIFVMLHEFWTADQFSKSRYYQFMMLILWLSLFLIMSYRDSVKKENIRNEKEEKKVTSKEFKPQ